MPGGHKIDPNSASKPLPNSQHGIELAGFLQPNKPSLWTHQTLSEKHAETNKKNMSELSANAPGVLQGLSGNAGNGASLQDDLRDLEDDFGDLGDEDEGAGDQEEAAGDNNDSEDEILGDVDVDDIGDEQDEEHDFVRSIAITDELTCLHKSLRDHYSIRFPELESLVTTPIKYAKTVAILLNGPLNDIKTLAATSENLAGEPLSAVLDGPSLMVVAVEGTTTRGRDMSEKELNRVCRICQKILKLDRQHLEITERIKSRMADTAPNLAAIIGTETAAQFLNAVGGLAQLSALPACNLGAIGSRRQEGTGFATNHGVRAKGYLYDSPIFENIPEDNMKKGIRIVGGKMMLAVRVDVAKQHRDGSYGLELKEQCLTKLDKLSAPAPNSSAKALPAPDEKGSTKRGGWRARKAKEATTMTEMRKAQNRIAFGQEEAEVGFGTGSGTVGLGMLGQENQGNIRATQIDKRTAAKLSKNNQGWATNATGNSNASLDHFTPGASGIASSLQARGLRQSGVGSQTEAAGTASTIAFTPAQGLELVDPKAQAELKRKREEEENRWFSSGTFTQAPNQGSDQNGGFKVPALPNKRANTGNGAMGPPK
ncbi:unnamed protein product [Penicillium salamii]|uniref:Nop domain-containing protein n=1 Tax=Penicillium salamii TaxID=1612424 RepID=A0A9W4JR45_9EURO|nr:unnamed protein product [Penicillium salamii]CAG8397061.1 unnamed protein product [Penicillium salamii]CAG8416230.1 unnamed protein product [Penicillium salamii]CAG8421520.1 unnamed protein product [Penicillium salamii]